MTSPATDSYSGRDNLEAMMKASRYNAYLVDLVLKNAVGNKVLDHGAGVGTFAVPVSERGMQVLCMEPDPELRAALQASGLDVAARLDEIEAGSIDYAYTLNVLEHIEDDGEALQQVFRCLRPGGQLLVYVPAFPLLYSRMDAHVGHFRRYRRKALVGLLQSVGFDVGKARYVDSLGFFATLLYKLVGDRSGRISGGSVSVYDTLVFPLSRVVDVLTLGSFGKNLVVVAIKNSHGEPECNAG